MVAETTKFKPYNFTSLGANVGGGHLHPLMKVRKEFRMILLEMGFEEMPTNKWVESSFWNFDSVPATTASCQRRARYVFHQGQKGTDH